jgi:hypothetical protein
VESEQYQVTQSSAPPNSDDDGVLEASRRWYARQAHHFTPAARRMLLDRGVHLSVDPAQWLRQTDEREIAAVLNEQPPRPRQARLRFKGERNRDRRVRAEVCARGGETSHLEHHHFAPMALTGRLGLPERSAVTLCRVCERRTSHLQTATRWCAMSVLSASTGIAKRRPAVATRCGARGS